MNLLEQEINKAMSRMDESQTAQFLHKVGKYQPSQVSLFIGRYVEGGTLVMLATTEGQRIADTTITGLLNINEHYKSVYLSQDWRQAIKDKLNRNKAAVLTN